MPKLKWRPSPRTLTMAGALVLPLLALAGYLGLRLSEAESLPDFGPAPDFALTDQFERPVGSEEMRGKIVVANFIYTNCTDICPLLSGQMQGLQERLRGQRLLGSGVELLSFTVDPDRDTPAVLRDYAERHRADPDAWRFLTGPPNEVVPLIVQGFKLGVAALPPKRTDPGEPAHGEAPAEGGEIMHSGRFVLIDRRGRIRAYYDGRELDPEQVMRDVQALLS